MSMATRNQSLQLATLHLNDHEEKLPMMAYCNIKMFILHKYFIQLFDSKFEMLVKFDI